MPKPDPIPHLSLPVYHRTLRPAFSIHPYVCGDIITESGREAGRLKDHKCASSVTLCGRIANSSPPRWVVLCRACAYPGNSAANLQRGRLNRHGVRMPPKQDRTAVCTG